MDELFAVIMAGGGGTRLWPLSRRGQPKQTLALGGDASLFQSAVNRILPLIPAERIRVVTVADQRALLQAQTPQLPEDAFILEPMPKGTASVVGLAAAELEAIRPDAIMAVLTADHHIGDPDKLNQLLAAAAELARDGHLVTLGLEPTKPESGYGYLELGESMGEVGGVRAFRVDSFREKPSVERATEYLAAGNFRWNSGMFVWQTAAILRAIRTHMPDLADGLNRYVAAIGEPNEQEVLDAVWQGLQPQTIDYGVMERAKNVVALDAAGLGWVDIGSFDRVFEVLAAEQAENVIEAERAVALDTSGTLLLQEAGQERLVAVLGLKDMVVIDTKQALLVVPRDRAQEVRALVDELMQRGLEQYL